MLSEKILAYRDELWEDLNTLMSIESVDGSRDEDCRKALEFMLGRARDFGLTAECVTDQSGQVDLGSGGRLCGVLTHLDVVPAGNHWSCNPYALTERDGRLFGRGIADDKGAAMTVLYCMRALKEMGVEGKNTLRAIFGTAEETGMKDMTGYFEKKPLPDLAFTPDSNYGVCYAEKGILQLEVSMPANEATVLSQFHAGKAVNAVPDLAYVMLDSSDYDEQQLLRLADAREEMFEFNYTIDGLMIISRGRAAHACEPEKGVNAAAALVDLIANVFESHEIGAVVSFIDYTLHRETNGRSMGLKMGDAVSGALTVNLGSIHIEGDEAYARFDIRYPVTVNGDDVARQFRKVAENSGLRVKLLHHAKPLYVEKDSELVRLLCDAYRAVMGEEPDLYATGGGTYARMLGGRGVAFGPNFPHDNIRMHNADESVDKESFLRHMQICFEAMYRLYTTE